MKMKLKTIAHKELINNRYKTVKPYLQYIVITENTTREEVKGGFILRNFQIYTKLSYKNGKINKKNEMVLIDQSSGVFMNNDNIGIQWIWEEKEIDNKAINA